MFWKKLGNIIKILFITGLGTGFIPLFPGTAGSLFALFLYWIFLKNSFILFPLTVLIFIAGIPLSTWGEKYFKQKDCKKIVIDEIAGMLFTLWAIFPDISIYKLIAAFFFFRLMDISKPYPIKMIEKNLSEGYGIMLDDIIAGFYAFTLVKIFVYFYSALK